MPDFVYTAKDATGKEVQGRVAAAARADALVLLRGQALFPIQVKAQGEKPAWQPARRRRRVSSELIAANLSQLADLLSNGVSLLASLDILVEQASHETVQEVFTQVRRDVAEGMPLEDALARHPRIFNELVISMVKAGAAGAFLEEALQRTATFLTTQQELMRRVKGALAYPAFLAVAGTITTVVLIVFFVPKFADMFARMEDQGGLPWATVLLLALSDILGKYGLLIGAGLVGLVVGIRKWLETENGREFRDQAKLRLPLFGPILTEFVVARFCRVLGTLLSNGVSLLKALDISAESAGNRVFARAIRSSAENVTSGESLSRPLAESQLFPRPVMAMLSVAEEANNLENVLLAVSERLEKRNMQRLDMLVRMLEPLMLLLMGTIMLFVIVALLLPVFDMGSTIG